MKNVNQIAGKGLLEIDFASGKATITEITKDSETTYDFFEILNRFNDKHISFRFSEENPIEPLEDI